MLPVFGLQGDSLLNAASTLSVIPVSVNLFPESADDLSHEKRLAKRLAICQIRMGMHGLIQRKDTAGEGIRTLDINLGKVALYQLSYARIMPMLYF